MRTWPYQMLSALPQKHLSAQWRECCAICGMVTDKNTGEVDLNRINHTTINRIKEYPKEHFAVYTMLVYWECNRREYKCRKPDDWVENAFNELKQNSGIFTGMDGTVYVNDEPMFCDFHNEYYLTQCMWMFQEKYMSGQINEKDWKLLMNRFTELCEKNGKYASAMLKL